MGRVVIGLGSNLGDRHANLDAAVVRLRALPELQVRQRSPIYETTPAGGPPQGRYLNAAVLLVTGVDAHWILGQTLAIERDLGRDRAKEQRWGPRVIDLDLLWIEGQAITTPDLIVPHPRLCERPFALRPLLDVAPDACEVSSGLPYARLPAASVALDRVAAG